MVGLALFYDGAKATIDLLSFGLLGWAINPFINFWATLTFWFWFSFLGVKFFRAGKLQGVKIASLSVPTLMGMFPLIGSLPQWTMGVMINLASVYAEDILESLSPATLKAMAKVARKVDQRPGRKKEASSTGQTDKKKKESKKTETSETKKSDSSSNENKTPTPVSSQKEKAGQEIKPAPVKEKGETPANKQEKETPPPKVGANEIKSPEKTQATTDNKGGQGAPEVKEKAGQEIKPAPQKEDKAEESKTEKPTELEKLARHAETLAERKRKQSNQPDFVPEPYSEFDQPSGEMQVLEEEPQVEEEEET